MKAFAPAWNLFFLLVFVLLVLKFISCYERYMVDRDPFSEKLFWGHVLFCLETMKSSILKKIINLNTMNIVFSAIRIISDGLILTYIDLMPRPIVLLFHFHLRIYYSFFSLSFSHVERFRINLKLSEWIKVNIFLSAINIAIVKKSGSIYSFINKNLSSSEVTLSTEPLELLFVSNVMEMCQIWNLYAKRYHAILSIFFRKSGKTKDAYLLYFVYSIILFEIVPRKIN